MTYRDLIELLADAGTTQQSAADTLHVQLRTVQRWCAGTVPVPYSAEVVLRLAAGQAPEILPLVGDRRRKAAQS